MNHDADILQALLDMNGILRDIRGRDTIVRRDTGIAASDIIGDIDLNQTLLVTPFAANLVHRITFINIPTNVTQFQVRLNFPDAPVIDVLLSGNTIVSTKPIARIFVSATPVIPEIVKMISGDLQVFDSTGGVRPSAMAAAAAAATVRSALFTHTMIAADDLTLLFPRVPANESHIYDSLGIQHDDSAVNIDFIIRGSVESPSTFALSRRTFCEFDNWDDSNRLNMLANNAGFMSSSQGEISSSQDRELQLFQDERMIIQMYGRAIGQSFAIGAQVRLQYRYRIVAPAASLVEDTQSITAVESEFINPEP